MITIQERAIATAIIVELPAMKNNPFSTNSKRIRVNHITDNESRNDTTEFQKTLVTAREDNSFNSNCSNRI
jgi:hypothetical protein